MQALSSDIKRAYIIKQPVFSQLTQEEINTLVDLFAETHFKAGDTIVTEGEPVDSVYLIVQGEAEVRQVTLDKGETHIQVLATLNSGDSVGLKETGFYSLSGIRTATVVARSDMVTLCLSMPKFHGFALAYPHVNEIMRQQSPIDMDSNL